MSNRTTPTAYTISARYGLNRSLSPLPRRGDGTQAFVLWGESRYVRGGDGMIDFEGGPFVSTGEFLDPDAPQPVYLVDCIGTLPCLDGGEIVIGAQWMEREDAAHALSEPLDHIDPERKRSFALVTVRY